MIRPIATARPPSDIKFSVSPVRYRKPKLIIRLSGIASEAISVARQLLRNTNKTNTLKHPPMTMASRTLAMAVRTSIP